MLKRRSLGRTVCLVLQSALTLLFLDCSLVGIIESSRAGVITETELHQIIGDDVFCLITLAAAFALFVYYRQDSGIESKLLPLFFLSATLTDITLVGRYNMMTRYSMLSPNLILKIYLFSILLTYFLLAGSSIFFQSLNSISIIRYEQSVLLASALISYVTPVNTALFGNYFTPFEINMGNSQIILFLAFATTMFFVFNYLHDSTQTSWLRSLSLILADIGISLKLFFYGIPVRGIGIALFAIGMVIFIIETRKYNIWD